MCPISIQDKNRQRFTKKRVSQHFRPSETEKRYGNAQNLLRRDYFGMCRFHAAQPVLLYPPHALGRRIAARTQTVETHPLRQHHHDCGFVCLVEMVLRKNKK